MGHIPPSNPSRRGLRERDEFSWLFIRLFLPVLGVVLLGWLVALSS